MNQEMLINKLGGPKKISHLKWWAADPPTLRTTGLEGAAGQIWLKSPKSIYIKLL